MQHPQLYGRLQPDYIPIFAATIPYTGTGTSVVYAMPSADTVYTATATAPGPTFCESTQTVAIAVTPQVGGTLSGNQVSCDSSTYTNITLSGHVGNILGWEYADDLCLYGWCNTYRKYNNNFNTCRVWNIPNDSIF
ncbi:hypothetical protein H9X57_15195 [Flavobacterium piscinae]|uniref:hypothetical protein n=1 Tax=Flavobacterium piscinae TaxID=2506424 RepID=UPI0019A0B89D|nr:hypothetical protein [Flavobacterium piscinae]MBC8884217.1 hypothetical protein [Flavobacterium piscinae]